MQNNSFNSTQNHKIISYPLSENQILELQNTFLTCGVHSLKIDKKEFGKVVFSSILNSLNYHSMIGCLSENSELSQNNIQDVLCILLEKNYLEDKNCDNLISFFIEDFNFDFLWIEESPILKKQNWYKQFVKYLFEFELPKKLPIIFAAYDE